MVMLMVFSLVGCSDSKEESNINLSEGVTSINEIDIIEWRQFLRDYEAWVDEYIAKFEKYKENPEDVTIMSEYTKMIPEILEWEERSQNIEAGFKDGKEALEEYLEEILRIEEKFAEAVYKQK